MNFESMEDRMGKLYIEIDQEDERLEPQELANPIYPCTISVPFLHSSEPHFKISVTYIQVVRSTLENTGNVVEYIVTPRGVVNSHRLQDGTVKIGRQQLTDKGERPNDIMLSASDRAISRSHCMIAYENFFNIRRIPNEWVAFLMAEHPRLGKFSTFRNLPAPLFRLILMYLREPRAPVLIDLGSVCGSYLKVSHEIPVEIMDSQLFLVGNDVIIEIEKVVNEPVPQSIPSEGPIEELGNTMFDMDLFREDCPYIIISVSRMPADTERTIQRGPFRYHVEEKYKKITIGRSQLSDIHLPENTISRTQCRVIYDHGKWWLFDGVESKASVNGTWLSICKKSRKNREMSDPVILQNGDQIKISETVLKVHWDERCLS
jgi:pSer/pThr/pTyr-binding forkhead associated (FHA) protein